MSEFVQKDLTGQVPESICARCASAGILHLPSGTEFVHCPHGLRAAVRVPGREWKILLGIEASNFRDVVVRALTVAELRHDVARGLAGIVQDQARNAVQH